MCRAIHIIDILPCASIEISPTKFLVECLLGVVFMFRIVQEDFGTLIRPTWVEEGIFKLACG
jgi:hypothetical protein